LSAESVIEKMLKIGQYRVKTWTRVWCHVFWVMVWTFGCWVRKWWKDESWNV